MQGYGTFWMSDGWKYLGDFHKNKLEGFGIMEWASGKKYEGEFKGGHEDSEGTKYYPNGQ